MINMKENGHPIRVVARRTGLTTHIIRAWEKRYEAVVPMRSDKNRRLYSEKDIEKLSLLHEATQLGWRISEIADFSIDRLKKLIAEDRKAVAQLTEEEIPASTDNEVNLYINQCLQAIIKYDDRQFDKLLTEAEVEFGQNKLIEKVIIPLLYKVGDLWEKGELRVGQEHMASAILRTHIGNMTDLSYNGSNSPHITITTPTGHVHENGALAAAAVATAAGWNVTYLGPNLPAEEIANAARHKNSKAVALSLIYPSDDPSMTEELKKIRQLLPDEILLIVGGSAAKSYEDVFEEIKAIYLKDISRFRKALRELRK